MASVKTRSKSENVQELQRLQAMYNRLPPEKQRTHRAHMQKRIDQLMEAIDGRPAKGTGGTILKTALLVVLACVVALGLGFFGVTYFVKA